MCHSPTYTWLKVCLCRTYLRKWRQSWCRYASFLEATGSGPPSQYFIADTVDNYVPVALTSIKIRRLALRMTRVSGWLVWRLTFPCNTKIGYIIGDS